MNEPFDTYAFRFGKESDPKAPAIIYLLQGDFHTPQDCFVEGTVPHWDKPAWRKETWGNVAGPRYMSLGDKAYRMYEMLAKYTMKQGIRDATTTMVGQICGGLVSD